MHTLLPTRVVVLCVGVHTSDLEALGDILGDFRTIGVRPREDISFRAILVEELEVIDIGSTVTRIHSSHDLRDRLVLHVVSNEFIGSLLTIVDPSLNAILEDELNAAERAISFANFNLLKFQRLEFIFAFSGDELFQCTPSECFGLIRFFGDVSQKLHIFNHNAFFFIVVESELVFGNDLCRVSLQSFNDVCQLRHSLFLELLLLVNLLLPVLDV